MHQAEPFFTEGIKACSTWCSSQPPLSFLAQRLRTSKAATGCEALPMTLDYWLGAAVSVLLVGYLVYALLRPERF